MEFHPLNSDRNEIRLLTLLPGDEDTTVCCSLEHVSLINPPEYCALSYCWGDPQITTQVIINKIPIQVTTNLKTALRCLRSKGYTRLWVDAICINQQDKSEMNQQLLWMGSIYRRAMEVAAYVGEEDDDSDAAFDHVSNSPSDLEHTERISGMCNFLERSYWKRIWIIQELAFAKSCVIHCGARDLKWETLAKMVEVDGTHYSNPALANFQNLVRFHNDAKNIKPLRLLEALSRSCNALSTDPRDKLFALLGLVYDYALYLPVPNYKQSVEALSLSIADSILSTTSSLDELVLLGSGCHSALEIPSWMPNWFALDEASSQRQCRYIVHGVTFLPNEGEGLGTDTWYSASRNTKASYSINSGVLQISGYTVDEVDGLCPTMLEAQQPDFQFPTDWQSTALNVREGSAISYEVVSDIAKAITGHLTFRGGRGADIALNIYFDLLWGKDGMKWFERYARPQMLAWIRAIGSFKIQNRSVAEWAIEYREYGRDLRRAWQFSNGTKEEELEQGQDVSLRRLMLDMEEMLPDGMRFMTTKKGYYGWAHSRSRKGDVICLLEGCSVPAILRPRDGGGYVLVGDAYVEGAMYGELFVLQNESELIEIH